MPNGVANGAEAIRGAYDELLAERPPSSQGLLSHRIENAILRFVTGMTQPTIGPTTRPRFACKIKVGRTGLEPVTDRL